MNTLKNIVLLGAGYMAGKMSKKTGPGIGAVSKGKYFIEYMKEGIERTEVFDKIPKGAYKGQTGILYLTRLTDYGTTLIPITKTKDNLPLIRK